MHMPATGYTPSTGDTTTPGATDDVIITPPQPFEEMELFSDVIVAGQMACMVSPETVTTPPRPKCLLVFAGVTWHITAVDTLTVNDTILAWILGLEK